MARILLVVIVASTVQALFPANPLAPGWYLRVAQMLVDYSPAFLLALSLALLSRFSSSSFRQSALARTLTRRLLGIGLAVYAVLVPLQIGSFAWLWFSTASEVNKGMRSAEAQLQPLQERIHSATSSADLWAALASIDQMQPPAPPQMPPLTQQKQMLLRAIDRRLSQQLSTLSQRRIQLLTSQLSATLRGVVAAASVAAGLYMIRRKV